MEHINTKDRFKCKLLFDCIKNQNFKMATELAKNHNININNITYDNCYVSNICEFNVETKRFHIAWTFVDNNISNYRYELQNEKMILTLIVLCDKMNVLHLACFMLLIYYKLLDPYLFANVHIKYLSKIDELTEFITILVQQNNSIVNTIDGTYNTGLHYIAKTQYVSIAKQLIDTGTDIYAVNKYNRNVIDIAREVYEKTIQNCDNVNEMEPYKKMLNFLTDCDKNTSNQNDIFGELNESNESIKCIICMTENKNILVLPCKHISTCDKCFVNFQNKTEKCCVCRSRVVEFMKVYII
jgi:hypothetical protein